MGTSEEADDEQPMTVGERIRALRETKRWSQPELAERVGISLQAVNRLETGRAEMPHRSNLRRYADALGTTVDYLLTGEQPRDEDVREMGMEEFLRGHAGIDDPADQEWFIKMWRLLRSSRHEKGGGVHGPRERAEGDK